MKKLTLFFAALCCAITANAFMIVDGIYYDVDLFDKTATVIKSPFFDNYSTLEGKITIPANFVISGQTYTVTGIEDEAFHNAQKITSVAISNGITSIGANAFSACLLLDSVKVPASVISIGEGAFSNNPALTHALFANSLEVIPDKMLYNCTSLASFTMPSALISIGEQAFAKCPSLKSIVLPDNVALVGKEAFKECLALHSLTIPASVALIDNEAFSECVSLKYIVCRVASPLAVNQQVFYHVDCPNVMLLVPNQSLEAYKAYSVWKNFAVKTLNYDIRFVVNGATAYSVSMEYGTPAADVKAEARLVEQQMAVPAGMVFKHWNPEITDVTASHAYEAVIEPAATVTKCTIQFAVNGVPKTSFLLDEGSSKADVEYLADIFLDQVDVPADLEFKYWEPALAAVTDNQTYNAVYDYIDQNSYPVSFVINGETVFTVDLKYGTEDWVVEGYANAVANSAVYPEGMTFKDWDKYFDKVTGPETYTARLRPIGQGIEEVSSSLQGRPGEASKFLRNGQLFIDRNGKIYNAQGALIIAQ